MEIKIMTRILFLSFFVAASASLYSQVKNADSLVNKQRIFLKEYALCKCIDHGFKEDHLLKKDFSLTVLIEQLNYDPKAYLLVDSLIKRFVDSISVSKYLDTKGKRGVMINCIDYYNSKEFDLFIKELDKYL